MHPTLARYLNPDVAVDTLTRDERGQVLKAEERPFAEVARTYPERRALVLQARGKAHLSQEAQQALLTLAAYAAVASLRDDERLGPAVQAAREALSAEGATAEEVDQFLATVLLEEAFGGEDDPDTFDLAFVRETLEGVPALAGLTRERVDELVDGFTRPAPDDLRRIHRLAARELLEAAWSEGPQPINHEHMEQAVESLGERLGRAHLAAGIEALRRFVEHLDQAGLVGARRKTRLLDVLQLAAQTAGQGGPAN